ncbi:MAG TPA: hypothetical protein DF984_04125 [Anaerolineaceae bacterium]|jgi:hypothetical protein|nr:hypothetical protein [Anaerolineaceae bacterium]
MAKRITQHVVPNPNGGWAVRKGGSDRVTRTFTKQSDAISFAKYISKNQGAELYIHGRNGMIREKNSYGIDPLPPRDKSS